MLDVSKYVQIRMVSVRKRRKIVQIVAFFRLTCPEENRYNYVLLDVLRQQKCIASQCNWQARGVEEQRQE